MKSHLSIATFKRSVIVAAMALCPNAQGQSFKLVDSSIAANVNQEPGSSPLFYISPQAQHFTVSAGIAAADFDNDGDIDFFVPNGPVDGNGAADADRKPNVLYVNNLFSTSGGGGAPSFTPVEFPTQVVNWDPVHGNLKSVAALWVDYDGDRLLDLIVFGDIHNVGVAIDLGTPPVSPWEALRINDEKFARWAAPRLYRQRHDGMFEDRTIDAGLLDIDLITDMYHANNANPLVNLDQRQAGGYCAGDLNGDGYPEIFMAMWRMDTGMEMLVRNARLLINEQGITGRKYVEAPGGTLTDPILDPDEQIQDDGSKIGSLWQPVMVDLDGDGDLDIFASCDGQDNRIWINDTQPGGLITLTYIDVQSYGVQAFNADMGTAVGDYDNDSDIDVFTTDIVRFPGQANNLYKNELTANASGLAGSFLHVSDSACVESSDTWNWGSTFADLDNDGWMDLLVTGQLSVPGVGSHVYINTSTVCTTVPATDRGFHDEKFVGISDVAFPSDQNSSTVIALDYDRDGDLDLLETIDFIDRQNTSAPADVILYENIPTGIGQSGYSLTVKPRGSGPNGHAVGSKISVHVDRVVGTDLSMSRMITAGISFMGHEPAEAHFGLGDLDPVDVITITVDWLDPNESPTTIVESGANIIAGSSVVGGNIYRVGWCSYADVAQPFGQLDFFDVSAFLESYDAGESEADLAAPYGQLNFFDVSRFLVLYDEGCNLK